MEGYALKDPITNQWALSQATNKPIWFPTRDAAENLNNSRYYGDYDIYRVLLKIGSGFNGMIIDQVLDQDF